MAIYEHIIRHLSPLLGEATAKNLLTHYCVKMRISIEDLSANNLPEVATAMRPMMAVWLGSEGASRASQEIANLGSISGKGGLTK